MDYRISFIPKKGSALNNLQTHNIRQLLGKLPGVVEGLTEKGSGKGAVDQLTFVLGSMVCGSGLRTICAPKQDLKIIQRRIASELQRFPPHPACYGFTPNRDAFGCAQAHVSYWGKVPHGLVILNMDAKDFFHSLSGRLVKDALVGHKLDEVVVGHILQKATVVPGKPLALAALDGLYRMAVAQRLASGEASMTDAFERLKSVCRFKSKTGEVVSEVVCRALLSLGPWIKDGEAFTPQGAPTSPILSNLCMKLVDIRLTAMARAFGGFYTRYADDLTVSWPVPTKGKVIDGMYRCATEVIGEYGILMNRKKKRVMGTGSCQDIVGYCVNAGRPTISQRKYRKPVRHSIKEAQNNGSIETMDLERLRGQLAFVGTAHPTESHVLWTRVQGAIHGKGPDLNIEENEHHSIAVEFEAGVGTGEVIVEPDSAS